MNDEQASNPATHSTSQSSEPGSEKQISTGRLELNNDRLLRYKKRSFLKLPVEIDIHALLSEYGSIPTLLWNASKWDSHSSTSWILLKGGQGIEDYFVAPEVIDASTLAKLPYISWLLSDAGPFGEVACAYFFRTKPMGVTRPHTDDAPGWKDTFRIHVPITTNEGAFLLSERRAKHLRVGEAWTFDNQSLHAAVNGNSVRTHLLFDVPRNPTLDALLEPAEWDPGIEDHAKWEQCFLRHQAAPVFTPASFVPLSLPEKLRLGLNPDGFASRISRLRWIARMRRTPLKDGDVVYSVNQVEETFVAATLMGHIRNCHKPGETVELGLIRDERRLTLNLKLHKTPSSRIVRMWSKIRCAAQKLHRF